MTGPALLSIADPAVGAIFLLASVASWRRSRRPALLLLAGGVCWYAGALLAPLLTLHQGALVHLVATFPSGHTRGRRVLVGVVTASWVLALLGGVLVSVWPGMLLAGILGVVLASQALGEGGAARRGAGASLVATVAYGVVLVLAGINVLAGLDADLAMALTYDAVVALTAGGLALALLGKRWEDDAAAELVSTLDTSAPAVAGLELHLRRVLDDPALTVRLWSDEHQDQGEDLEGTDPAPSGRRSRTVVLDDAGRPTAVLVHDPGLLDNEVILDAATAAVRLAVANVQMRSAAAERIERLATARRRLVEATDLERQALARRLDLGPRRHLLAARRSLDETECADGATGRTVRRELELVPAELRDLANGVRPAALTDGGLVEALPLLATGSALPITMRVDVGRLEPAVEAAVYFVCAEAIANVTKHARATRVRVRVGLDAGAVVATIDDDGVGGADPAGSGLQGLADRVEALGGSFEVGVAETGGVLLSARLPLGVQQARP